VLLRDSVCAAVDELRLTGRASKHVVMLIRCLATEAGMHTADARGAIDEIEAWCIQRFYAPQRYVAEPVDTNTS
jgi:hypothetical protein